MRKLGQARSAAGRGIVRRWWLPVLAVVALGVPLASSSGAAADGGASADVSVVASAGFDSVSLVVTNAGPATASGLTLAVSGATSLFADAGTCVADSCSLDTLASGQAWTVTAAAGEVCGPPATVSGTVTTSSDDPNHDNDTGSDTVLPQGICVGCTTSLGADAGPPQTVGAGDTVTLAGSPPLSDGAPACTTGGGGTAASWEQIAGTNVVLAFPNGPLSPTFTAPPEAPGTSEVLTFRLTETAPGADPGSDTVDITVEGPADATPPTVDLTTPGEGSIYRQGQSVLADYACDDDVALASCIGTVDDGEAIDTSSLGWQTFTVTAQDAAGHSTPVTHHYYVTATSTTKPQSWGNVTVVSGTTVRVGYDFTLPGKHPAARVSFVGGQVAFAATCVSGGSATTLVVPIADASTDVPLNSTAWYPSGDQNSSLVYQGTLQVPATLCGGGQALLGKATFSAGILASQSVKLNYRWHYNVNGVGGGWSGTTGLTPDLLPPQ